MSEKRWYVNHYECPDCNYKWGLIWTATCDDRCPRCDVSYTPLFSEDYEDDEWRDEPDDYGLDNAGRTAAETSMSRDDKYLKRTASVLHKLIDWRVSGGEWRVFTMNEPDLVELVLSMGLDPDEFL